MLSWESVGYFGAHGGKDVILNCDLAVTFGIAALAAVEIQRDCAATAVEIVLGADVEIFGTKAAENCDFSFVDFPPFPRS